MNTRNNTYFYFRNGLLHIRHMVDEAVELSEYETENLKNKLSKDPANKQEILAEEWDFQTKMIHKKPSHGIEMANANIQKMNKKYCQSSNNTKDSQDRLKKAFHEARKRLNAVCGGYDD